MQSKLFKIIRRANPCYLVLIAITAVMLVYFIIAKPVMMDDGFHYQGFAEALAGGRLDFQNFYGFQGLAILSVPVFWLTHSSVSIIITSAILSLFSIWLAYAIGRDYYQNKKSGLYFVALFLLIPYPYVTMMRGFQEAALLFFILLVIYGSIRKKLWTPLAWAFGGIVKPFTLVLFPLFFKAFLNKRKIIWLAISLLLGVVYLGLNFYQTGHLVTNAAINSYQGGFDTADIPPLGKSFIFGAKNFLRIGANLFIYPRKILISPLVLIFGACFLWSRSPRLKKEFLAVIGINILLVGALTFSFQKYLLSMAILLALLAVPYLLKFRWLPFLILADSFFVFLPIYYYFGRNFWPNLVVFLVPWFLAVVLFAVDWFGNKNARHVASS